MRPRKPRPRLNAPRQNQIGNRTRCYECYRPVDSCFCELIPRIENRTNVLVVQHRRERFHPFNTARIVCRSLVNSTLVVGETDELGSTVLPLAENTGLLFPTADAQLLDDIPESKRPDQLVVLDGTWSQAKSLYRNIPALHDLPRYRLAPASPGRYRIRLEPTDESLSTVEATVAALQQLEPQTIGLEKLIVAFNSMVERQLAHPNAEYDREIVPVKQKPNVPSALRNSLDSVVVAYCEPLPVDLPRSKDERMSRRKFSTIDRTPVYFVVERIGTGESIECAIQTQSPLPSEFLRQMQMNESDFEFAVTSSDFAKAWHEFTRADDVLVAYNQNTVRSLKRVGAQFGLCFTLRSINYDPGREFSSLGDFLQTHSPSQPVVRYANRAGKRLANAVSLVKLLNQMRSQD